MYLLADKELTVISIYIDERSINNYTENEQTWSLKTYFSMFLPIPGAHGVGTALPSLFCKDV